VTLRPSTLMVSSKGVAAWRTAFVTTSLTSSSTVSVSPVKCDASSTSATKRRAARTLEARGSKC
jgi:hypothetical protein